MDHKAYRYCQKFDPEKYIVNGYLPVMYRMAWFHHYLQERNCSGSIDDSDFCVLPGIPLLIVKSTITIDGKIVGKACSAGRYMDSYGRSNWGQMIATQAKGRALAHAGFGTEEALSKAEFVTSLEGPKDTLRNCDYDARLDMIFVQDAQQVEPHPYLKVPYRIKWFHQYLIATHSDGYIDSSEVYYDAENEMLVATASVYINDKEVGRSIATLRYPKDAPVWELNPVATVCTAAVGRALLNAGFGVTAWGNDDGYDEELCDAPVQTETQVTNTIALSKDISLETSETSSVAPETVNPIVTTPKKRGRKPKVKMEETTQEDTVATPDASIVPVQSSELTKKENIGMTKEEGLAYIMPMGPFAGHSLGSILQTNRDIVEFYAGEKFSNPKYTTLKQAAKMILQD